MRFVHLSWRVILRAFRILFYLLCVSCFLLLGIVGNMNGDYVVGWIGYAGAVTFGLLFSFACLYE